MFFLIGNRAMQLHQATDEQIQEEVARRKRSKRPQPKAQPDWSELLTVLNEAIASAGSDDKHVDPDVEHWVFEAALEAVYGKDVWEWWNAQ